MYIDHLVMQQLLPIGMLTSMDVICDKHLYLYPIEGTHLTMCIVGQKYLLYY